MDTSLCLYKEKLKEALVLVPPMSEERKVAAVSYWNDAAEQLQGIVQHKDLNYDGTVLPSNQDIKANEKTSLIYSKTVDQCKTAPNNPIHCDPVAINSLDSTNANESSLLTPTAPIDQYHEGLNLSIGVGSSDLAQDMYTALELQNILTESHDDLIESNKPILNLESINTSGINLGGLNVQENLQASNSVDYLTSNGTINNLSPSSGSNKLDQTEMNITAEFDDHIISSSLAYPGTNADITNEIGNGQYDRGPKFFYDANEFAPQFEQTSHSTNLPSVGYPFPSAFVSNRFETFTQSDRPLQQIQHFNPTTNGEYFNQSSSIMSGKSKCEFCRTCDALLESSQDFVRHQHVHSPPEVPSPSMSEIVDSESPKLVQPKEEAKSSMCIEKASKQHTCDVCGKSGFSTKGNLKRHLRAHSGEKPFKCDLCDSCFTEKKSLKIHVRRHTGEKPYKCEVCGKLFSQTGVLNSHMALHFNERKFNCHKCGRAFRQRSQLNLHLMRHDGVKRLQCSTCMAKFLTKGDLERHCRIHTGERPYGCTICNKTFTRQQSLNEHMNRHTGKKPYDCKHCDRTFSEMSACYKACAKSYRSVDRECHSLLDAL